VDPRDQQQIGVRGAERTCRDVVAKKRAEVSWLRGVENVSSKYFHFFFNWSIPPELQGDTCSRNM